MRFNKYVMAIVALPLVVAIVAGSYFVRWLAVIVLGTLLAFVFFGTEIQTALPRREKKKARERKTDVERTVALIQRAKKGAVARALLEERIIGIYATISEDYNLTYHSLISGPNEALRVLRSEGDFLDNLERALEIVEADLHENRRGKLEG